MASAGAEHRRGGGNAGGGWVMRGWSDETLNQSSFGELSLRMSKLVIG